MRAQHERWLTGQRERARARPPRAGRPLQREREPAASSRRRVEGEVVELLAQVSDDDVLLPHLAAELLEQGDHLHELAVPLSRREVQVVDGELLLDVDAPLEEGAVDVGLG